MGVVGVSHTFSSCSAVNGQGRRAEAEPGSWVLKDAPLLVGWLLFQSSFKYYRMRMGVGMGEMAQFVKCVSYKQRGV